MAGHKKAALTREEAMDIVVHAIANGSSVADACRAAKRSEHTYLSWRRDYPSFAERIDRARAAKDWGDANTAIVPDFPEFCEELGMPLPEHQLRAWDVWNAKEPRNMHETMTLTWSGEETNNSRTMFLFPPNHAKSTVWTIQLATWYIYRNPNVRIIIMCHSQELAKQFVQAVQGYLIDPMYTELQQKYGPKGGFKCDRPWTATHFYIRGKDPKDPDPTLQALGFGQKIYGRRCDLFISDDLETLDNVGMYQKHAEKLVRDADSRLVPGGRLLIVGTRVGAIDMYKYLRDNARDSEDKPGFTVFTQPAILENESLHFSKWTVLWPEVLEGRFIAQKKAGYPDQRKFQLIYQQNDISDDAPFPAVAVDNAVNRQRYPGIMHPSNPGCPPQGMSGLRVVGGVDPATTGGTAMVVMAVDPISMQRYVLDVFYERGVLADNLIAKMKELTDRYGVAEWRIERNAFQRFLTQLESLRVFMSARGVLIEEHMTTGQTKWDADWGVSTLIPLFMEGVKKTEQGIVPKPRAEGRSLIELPDTRTEGVRALVEQLKNWEPDMAKHRPTDCVMALWFAEIAAREYLLGRRATYSSSNRGKFVTPAMKTMNSIDPKARIRQILIDEGSYAYGAWGAQ